MRGKAGLVGHDTLRLLALNEGLRDRRGSERAGGRVTTPGDIL